MYNELGIIRKALFCIILYYALSLKMSKMALSPFCDETLHVYLLGCEFMTIFQNKANMLSIWSVTCLLQLNLF